MNIICMTFNKMLAANYNVFLNFEIDEDFRVMIDYYNRENSVSSSVNRLMEDI